MRFINNIGPLGLSLALAACAGNSGGQLPAVAANSMPAASAPSIQLSGSIAATYSGGFTLVNSSCGHIHVAVEKSTKLSGPAPAVGKTAKVVGTGSCATSITASSVAVTGEQSSSAPVVGSSGCTVFPAGDPYYNQNVSDAAVDPNSAAYIAAAEQAGDTGPFFASTGVEEANFATNATPLVKVRPLVSYHPFPQPYPWQSGYYIEPLGDEHAIVVQTQSCHLYESYETTYSGGVLSAFSGANWNLSKPFAPLSAGTPSAMASGLPMFAGTVTWTDYQSGSIRHPLNWDTTQGTVSQYGFVLPASHTGGLPFEGKSSYQLPWGAHLRLKSSVSTAGWGPQSTMVANAMKTYGIYLADTGTSGTGIYFANESNGTNPWNESDLASLGRLTLSDFQVLKLPAIQAMPGHSLSAKR